MSQDSKSVFWNQDVSGQLIAIIDQAQKYVVMVTPYLKFDGWENLTRAIERAAARRVDVTFVVRSDEKQVESSAVDWLISNKVKVRCLSRLHAKVYLNESVVMVSSMNTHSSSALNNLEIAMMVRDPAEAQEVRSYVSEHLLKPSEPIAKADPILDVFRAEQTKAPKPETRAGVCIRCRRQIVLNPSRPLCDKCYDEWAEYANVEYREKFCHICGKPSATTYAKPLCRECYQQVR